MAPSRAAWAEAFAEQARSDWHVYGILAALAAPPRPGSETGEAELSVSTCHALHYLQMVCEKIAKAYRLRDTAAHTEALMSGHVGFSSFVRAFLLAPPIQREFRGRVAQFRTIQRTAVSLAQEIERLAPSVDPDARPDNTEYPWADGDTVVVPAKYEFPNLDLLRRPGGRAFLLILERAVRGFEEIRIY